MACQVYLANRVQYLKKVKFSQLTRAEKCSIKDLGRPLPNLNIKQMSTSRGKSYERKFNKSIYERDDCGWIS